MARETAGGPREPGDAAEPGAGPPRPRAEVRIIELTPDDPRYGEARALRYGALYAPLALPRTLVEDTDVRDYVHFAALDASGAVVGCARLHLEDGESKAYQVVVAEELRGSGLGRALMDAVEDRARGEDRGWIELDARVHAVGFYERLGYAITSEEFDSPRTGTPHRRMRKDL